MDYFIHKDLGGFLRRELDFCIKNEVMRLDDIENATAPAVESYLAKIKVLRKIAGKLIDFLAQAGRVVSKESDQYPEFRV
jgi:adenine-specific DNA-methyltransferase